MTWSDGVIGELGGCYRLPWTMELPVFARIIVQRAGFDVSEAELTTEAVNVVCRFCSHLHSVTPTSPEAEYHIWLGLPSYHDPPRATPASGSAILERAVELALPTDRDVAYRAFTGLHPDLRAQRRLSRFRRVARAALVRG
jgi:hypothetical protein